MQSADCLHAGGELRKREREREIFLEQSQERGFRNREGGRHAAIAECVDGRGCFFVPYIRMEIFATCAQLLGGKLSAN